MGRARAKEEIEASFAAACAVLDDALAQARPRLEAAGAAIDDESNRSGFDWASYSYVWRYVVRREGSRDSCTARAKVALDYVEPEGDTAAALRCETVAEVFRPGQASFFRHADERDVSLSACAGDGLASLVLGALADATAALPDRYRAALAP